MGIATRASSTNSCVLIIAISSPPPNKCYDTTRITSTTTQICYR